MKTAAVKILERLKLPYALRTYDVDADELGAEEAARKLNLPLERVFKTLVVRGDRTGVVLACLPGSTTLSLKKLAAASGNKRCELVEVDEIHRLTGYLRGGVSPLGARKAYPLFLDQRAMQQESISVSAGMRGLQMFVSGAALAKVGNATLADLGE